MKRLALLILVVGFGLGACERHDIEETKRLHDKHENHDHHDHHENHDHADTHEDAEKH